MHVTSGGVPKTAPSAARAEPASSAFEPASQVPASGSLPAQVRQALFSAQATVGALRSKLGVPPGDLEKRLHALERNPPKREAPVARTEYRTALPDTSPACAFALFLQRPAWVLSAAQTRMLPAAAPLFDGTRAFLEEPGQPPVWAPVEFGVDRVHRRIVVHTLDGHPLRGRNEFRFEDDGQGGTLLWQGTEYQQSSRLVDVGRRVLTALGRDPLRRQHDIWQAVHARLRDTLA